MNNVIPKSSDQILADFLPDAVLILNKEGIIRWWNLAARHLFKINHNKDKPLHINEIINMPDFENISEENVHQPIEIELQQPKRRISLSLRPYLENDLLLIAQDITHIYHLEKMRQDFLANVSHELRTPLTVVHGYLETLLDQELDANSPFKNIFNQMYQQTLRMEHLVNDLLLLSRLEADIPEEQNYPSIDIAVLLTSICDEAQALSGDNLHKIHLNTEPGLNIQGLENELRSAFSNIIFNAVKYTPDAGEIFVDWKKINNKACLIVRDTGIGIEPKHIPRLTERFYRVDKARSRKSGGTGLGLAIVKHVLIRHHAKLKIESAPGEGSVFTCIFPST